MKKFFKYFLVISLLLRPLLSNASHQIGGGITWTYAKTGPDSGKFKFQVTYYRDCNGIPPEPTITLTTNAPGWATGILCIPISTTEISPIGVGCPSCAATNGFSITMQKIIYESAFITIIGTPPSTGYNFWWNSCCRNSSLTNLNIGYGMTLRSIMYPFNNQNTFPAYVFGPPPKKK